MYPAEILQSDVEPGGIYLQLAKYCTPLKRLINSLNEYKKNAKTYSDPEKYLDILLSSVATEINNEIAAAKDEEERQLAKKSYAGKAEDIEEQKLDVWTHNKTIQKAVESYRITPEQKEYLKSLKVKKA